MSFHAPKSLMGRIPAVQNPASICLAVKSHQRIHASCSEDRPTPPPAATRLLFAAGGTGGHVYPALAVAQHIKLRFGDAVSCEFAGSRDRMEWELVPKEGFKVHPVPAVGLRRPLHSLENLLLPFRVLYALARALLIVARLRPHVVIGTGGYISFPTCLAAWILRCPVVVQEQNAVPGLANRFLSLLAARICVAFPECVKQLHGRSSKCLVTGNPVRSDLIAKGSAGADEAKEAIGAAAGQKVLVVIGGSLGSAAINGAMKEASQQVLQLPDAFILWATGSQEYPEVQEEVPDHPRLKIVPYLYDMASAYAAADLLVARAGAMTCSELAVTGNASILVPLPSATDDHQTANARSMEERGAAVLMPETELTGTALAASVTALMSDPMALKQMQSCARALAPRREALEEVADQVLALTSLRSGQ